MIKKIECETCKYTDNCKRDRAMECLKIITGISKRKINGVTLFSFMNYEYALWEPKETILLLEDDLFEI